MRYSLFRLEKIVAIHFLGATRRPGCKMFSFSGFVAGELALDVSGLTTFPQPSKVAVVHDPGKSLKGRNDALLSGGIPPVKKGRTRLALRDVVPERHPAELSGSCPSSRAEFRPTGGHHFAPSSFCLGRGPPPLS